MADLPPGVPSRPSAQRSRRLRHAGSAAALIVAALVVSGAGAAIAVPLSGTGAPQGQVEAPAEGAAAGDDAEAEADAPSDKATPPSDTGDKAPVPAAGDATGEAEGSAELPADVAEILLGDEPANNGGDLLPVEFTVDPLPATVTAGTVISTTLRVTNAQPGGAAPGGQVALVALGDDDIELIGLDDLVDGETTLSFRPLSPGAHSIVAGYSGDDLHRDSFIELGSLTVNPAPTDVSISVPDTTIFGGGTTMATVSVTADDTTLAASPSGVVTLSLDGAVIGSGRIIGSPVELERNFAPADEDLHNDEATHVAVIPFDVPDVREDGRTALGLEAHFSPDNWFAEAQTAPYIIDVIAAESETSVFVGEMFNGAETVTGPTTLYAFVFGESELAGVPGAMPTGTVQFFVDGKAHGDPVTLDRTTAAIDWTPGTEAGTHTISAEYRSDSTNVTDSTSPEVAAKVDGPGAEPVLPPAGADNAAPAGAAAAGTASALASTGADGGPDGIVALLLFLVVGGVTLLVSRRRAAR